MTRSTPRPTPRPFPSRLACLLVTLLATIALPAQSPPTAGAKRGAAAAAAGRAAITAGFAGVFTHDGEPVAVGRNWRATFGARGAVFQPALGRAAPRAHTWALSTRELYRGDAPLLRTTEHTPERHSDRRAVTLRWPGVTERFTAEPDGLKHSYLFAERPAGEGDLVVRVDVTSELLAGPGADDWRDEHGLGVTLGPCVAIDASGRRLHGSKRLLDHGFELRLAAAAVAAAAFPLELDPLIGTAVQAYAGMDCDFPDVAYEAFSNTYCVVWTQFLGGGQTGVVGSIWLADPLGFGYAFAINQPDRQDSPRVTAIGGTGLFALVWVHHAANGRSIRGIGIDPIQALGTNVFTIDGPANIGAPTLSGEATPYDDDFLVAWLDDTYGLLARSVAIDLQLQVSATPIAQIAAGFAAEPAFSKQGGAPGLHLLTWVDRPPGLPGWIRAQVVDHDLNLRGPAAWIRNTPQNAGRPAVDGDGFRFLVAWEEQETGNPSATDLRGRIVTVGATGITSLGGVLDLAATAGDLDHTADVGLLGDNFGIVYAVATAAAPFHDDCYFRVVSPAGALIGGALRLDVTISAGYVYEHAPRLIGRRDGNPSTLADDGLVVFADQSITSFDSDVGLQAVESLGPGGPIVDLGGGCGPGGLAHSPGPFALGHPGAPLQLFGGQPLAIPFVLLGMPGARVQCGVCSFVAPTNWWFVANTAGSAATALPIPGSPALIGFQFDFQFLSLQVLFVGCPALPGAAASNIVRATVGA